MSVTCKRDTWIRPGQIRRTFNPGQKKENYPIRWLVFGSM